MLRRLKSAGAKPLYKLPGSRGGKVDALNLVSAAANPALLLRQDDNSNTSL
jgi:hypothetical protein